MLAFAVALVLLITYVVHFGRADFSSDDAVLSLQAESMWQQGTLFPKGWVGNNGDLMFPSGVLLIAPLLSWFANSYELHAVVGLIAVVLMLGSFSGFLLAARIPIVAVLLATAVVASGLSRVSAIMVFLQTTYVWWPAAFFLGATVIYGLRKSESRWTRASILQIGALALIVFMIALSNPGRALLMLVLPLYVFDRVLLHRSRIEKGEKAVGLLDTLGIADGVIVVGLASAFALATIVYWWLFETGTVQTLHNSSALRWEGIPGLVSHFRIFLFGWFDYLGGVREMNAPSGGVEDILQPIRLVFAGWISWVGIAETIRLFRAVDPLRNALVAAMLSAFMPILFMYLVFAPLAIDFSTTRYFTVPIFILLALAAFRASDSLRSGGLLSQALVVNFSMVLVLVCLVRYVPAASNSDLSLFQLRDSNSMRQTKLLTSENLRWGYATWWNAGVVTILSREAVRINPIMLTESGIEPYPNLNQQEYFQPRKHDGESFLLLSAGEASAERISALNRQLGRESRIITVDGNTILVYARNISSSFYCNNVYPSDAPLVRGEAGGHLASISPVIQSESGVPRQILVQVENTGARSLSGIGSHPISIGIRLLDKNYSVVDADWVHAALRCAVAPGEQREFRIEVPALSAGNWVLQANLVQEGVAWFEDLGVEPLHLRISVPSELQISRDGFE